MQMAVSGTVHHRQMAVTGTVHHDKWQSVAQFIMTNDSVAQFIMTNGNQWHSSSPTNGSHWHSSSPTNGSHWHSSSLTKLEWHSSSFTSGSNWKSPSIVATVCEVSVCSDVYFRGVTGRAVTWRHHNNNQWVICSFLWLYKSKANILY